MTEEVNKLRWFFKPNLKILITIYGIYIYNIDDPRYIIILFVIKSIKWEKNIKH